MSKCSDKQWNKLWELWSDEQVSSPYAELMTYQNEVENGGHEQYFDTMSDVGDLTQEMQVLSGILPDALVKNLRTAYRAYQRLRENIHDTDATDVLESCDDAFYDDDETINGILEAYAAKIEA